jgi:hypothetical protein
MNTLGVKSNMILRSVGSKYQNYSSKRIQNLAGTLRKVVGIKMLKKIQTSRKSDW